MLPLNSKIAIDLGHGTGGDRGANGFLNEEKIIREYGKFVIDGLRELGYIVYDVTPTKNNLTLSQSLAYRVNMANYYKVDLFVSLHGNCFEKESANGCEVLYISAKGKEYSDRICKEISSLGYFNRGARFRNDLYVLKHTSMPAVLIEPLFISNKADSNKYNAKDIAKAIIKGITGKEVFQKKTEEVKTENKENYPSIDHTIPNFEGIVIFGDIGYVQVIPNRGRIDLHLDKYNYISIQDDAKEGNKVWITTRTKGTKQII